MIHETEQERNLRLQTLQRNDAERLINENEEQRNLRLQRLRESKSIRIQAETEHQRHDRLQNRNTARRTEVETNEERQNKLQLLQQNTAMYRENERLQHLQDQNNRDSYLSNVRVEKCRTDFTRTTMNTQQPRACHSKRSHFHSVSKTRSSQTLENSSSLETK